MPNLLDQLNIQQRAAVEQTEGPLLILAGAGSGKTRVITYRIAHLIEARGVPPESILAVTFTNKAAAQMKERVAKLLDGRVELRAGAPHVSTFHSFCVSVLRRHIDHLGYSRDFSIYDDDDQQRLMKTCIQELGWGSKSPRRAACLSQDQLRQESWHDARDDVRAGAERPDGKNRQRSLTSTRRSCGRRTPWTLTTCC